MAMFDYQSGISTNGLGADKAGLQSQIDRLRKPSSSMQANLFGLNPYQRQRLQSSPNAMREINRQTADTNRIGRWGAANNLQTNMDVADQQAKAKQLSAASNDALNATSQMQNVANQERQIALDRMQMLNNFQGNLFGNLFGGMTGLLGQMTPNMMG